MVRQSPVEDFRVEEVAARVAVVSFLWDSAAADGSKTPPARETGTGVVGFDPV